MYNQYTKCVKRLFIVLQGPRFMSTEYKTRYKGDKHDLTTKPGDTDLKSDGSGFVHNQNIEPITFNPDQAHEGSVPVSAIHSARKRLSEN